MPLRKCALPAHARLVFVQRREGVARARALRSAEKTRLCQCTSESLYGFPSNGAITSEIFFLAAMRARFFFFGDGYSGGGGSMMMGQGGFAKLLLFR